MPAHVFAAIFHFDGEVAVEATADDGIVTHSPIAVQAQASEVNDECISGLRGFHEKRTGFGMATENAWDPSFVGATRIDGGGVNCVARRDGEDRLVHCGELAIKNSWHKFMRFRGGWVMRRC